jgi:hypothetical protein
MTATLAAILTLTVLGIPIVLTVDRSARGPLLVGTAFLYGSGTMSFVLLALSIVHVHWTLLSVAIPSLVIFCAASFFARRTAGIAAETANTKPHLLDLFTLFTVIPYALYARLATAGQWDFWAMWGLKARTFLELGGIDWRFLESRWNAFAHPDYPLLVPLNYDFLALVNGGWSDRWLGLICVAWAVALALVARSLAARETTPFFASLLTLLVAALGFSRYVGLAEGALIAFGGAGVLFIRTALRENDDAAWRHGALMLGFAANCKNEGLALLVAVTIAVLVVSRSFATLRKVAPAYVLAAPWLILRAAHVLPTDLAGGSAASRLIARLPHAHELLLFLSGELTNPGFWLAVVTGILIAPAGSRRRESFVFIVTAVQLLFYVAAYLATPHDVAWHVVTSWSRLTEQLSVPITFGVFLLLANSLRRAEDAPHAEDTRPVVPARSDE